MCAVSLTAMLLALFSGRGERRAASFTPPPFDPAAVSGTPAVDASLGWTEIYQESMRFRAYVCGNVTEDGGRADVYFANSGEFHVWLKLRILDKNGEILGESGLIRPGEYVKSVALKKKITDGQEIKMKIMAYEPDTYYSAGAAVLNTVIRKGGAG